jgi:hypothetical protein
MQVADENAWCAEHLFDAVDRTARTGWCGWSAQHEPQREQRECPDLHAASLTSHSGVLTTGHFNRDGIAALDGL